MTFQSLVSSRDFFREFPLCYATEGGIQFRSLDLNQPTLNFADTGPFEPLDPFPHIAPFERFPRLRVVQVANQGSVALLAASRFGAPFSVDLFELSLQSETFESADVEEERVTLNLKVSPLTLFETSAIWGLASVAGDGEREAGVVGRKMLVAVGGWKSSILRVYDAQTLDCSRLPMVKHYCLRIRTFRSELFVCSRGCFAMYDLNRPQHESFLYELPHFEPCSIQDVAPWDSHEMIFGVGTGGRKIRGWSRRSLECELEIDVLGECRTCLVEEQGGVVLALHSTGGNVEVFDPRNPRRCLAMFQVHQQRDLIYDAELLDDGRIATGSNSSFVVWTKEGKIVRKRRVNLGQVRSLFQIGKSEDPLKSSDSILLEERVQYLSLKGVTNPCRVLWNGSQQLRVCLCLLVAAIID